MTRTIVLFTRAPSAPGKTRLTAGLDPDAAHALRRALLLDTLAVVASASEPILVCFTPTTARAEIEALIAESAKKGTVPISAVSAIPQGENCDLGQRMYGALVAAQRRGAAQVILVGADLATLPVAHLHDAFAQLEGGSDVVLGPAEDGGYYLVGVSSRALAAAQPLFEHIAWGSDAVLTQTLAVAADVRLRTTLIPPWFDVDTRADLQRVRADRRLGVARHTHDWLAQFRV
jgi:rSAM/selenodomain-associated transferase 1